MSRMQFNIWLFVALATATLLARSPVAVSGSLETGDLSAQYKPLQLGRYKPQQTISYEYGSKFMSGFFVEKASQCIITFMVTEKAPRIAPPYPITPARFRLVLNPGQVAGLDSAEQRSLNFICGESAKNLLIDFGETDTLATRRLYSGAIDAARTQ